MNRLPRLVLIRCPPVIISYLPVPPLQYVPTGLDIPGLAGRLATAIGPTASCKVVEGGLHALDGREAEAVEILSAFVASLCQR